MPQFCTQYTMGPTLACWHKYFYFASSLLSGMILFARPPRPQMDCRFCRHGNCSNHHSNDRPMTCRRSGWSHRTSPPLYPDRPPFETAPRDARQPQAVRLTTTRPTCTEQSKIRKTVKLHHRTCPTINRKTVAGALTLTRQFSELSPYHGTHW